jgi:hypothetical protein
VVNVASVTKQKLLAVLVLGAVGAGAVGLLHGRGSAKPAAGQTSAAKDPRQVLGRPWFDRFPTSPRDAIDLWWFSSAGIGVHERGSVWRGAVDFFDFERQSSRLHIQFLQDKQEQKVSFEVVACDDKPPFDVCLEVKESLRGRTRFYSFAYDDEMDAHLPWARQWRVSAEARSRAAR